jgi:hypothetical protein
VCCRPRKQHVLLPLPEKEFRVSLQDGRRSGVIWRCAGRPHLGAGSVPPSDTNYYDYDTVTTTNTTNTIFLPSDPCDHAPSTVTGSGSLSALFVSCNHRYVPYCAYTVSRCSVLPCSAVTVRYLDYDCSTCHVMCYRRNHKRAPINVPKGQPGTSPRPIASTYERDVLCTHVVFFYF